MSLQDLLSLSATIIISLGGSGALMFGLSGWLGKIWAYRLMEKEKAAFSKEMEELKSRLLEDIERIKVQLKKSEFIFEREFQAASEFVSLINGMIPIAETPNTDWCDICEEIAKNASAHEVNLRHYISKHGAVMPDKVLNEINKSIKILATHKFDVLNSPSGIVPEQMDLMYNQLKEAEKLFICHIRTQTSEIT